MAEAPRRDSGSTRRSLRRELLFSLTFLAAAALLLALVTAHVLRDSIGGSVDFAPILALILCADLAIFALLGHHLIQRLVVRPLQDTVGVAEAISRGEYERRVPTASTHELATVGNALNRLTDQLLENQNRLAENVRSLNETNLRLTEAQQDLIQAEKMASIGRFSAGIAHEIGNPLGAILGYLSLLRKRAVDPEIVDGLERETRRIDSIVRGLLDYARPAAGPAEPVDVNASIRRVLDTLRAQGRFASIQVELDLERELPHVGAVPHRLDQVFVNLFTNAESAMEGEGTLSIVTRLERYRPGTPHAVRRADDPPGVDYSHLRRLRYGAVRESPQLEWDRQVVRIIVSDTGPGIPQDEIHAVFEPFFTTKSPGEGTGLGLSIVAGTIADLGGRIEATSAAGGGAVFSILLPTFEDAE